MLLFALILVFVAIAAGLAWFLVGHDHGEREPIGALWVAAGLGLAGAFAATYIESLFITTSDLEPVHGLAHVAGAALLVGIVEEACKFLPLAIYIYKKRYFNEHTDGVIYFALAGLGFGLPENIFYSLQFGSSAAIGRIIMTPFFHAAITAMVGYVLIRGKLAHRSLVWAVLALVGAMLAHAAYDFGLSSGRTPLAIVSVGITALLSGGLFVLFVKASERDQDAGLSVVGHNTFCRSCGQPNPQHHLYCTRCGKNA